MQPKTLKSVFISSYCRITNG